MIEEEWRDIPGYEGRYQVSDQGRVRSLDRSIQALRHGVPTTVRYKSRVLRPGGSIDGYPSVALGLGNSVRVHVLVALTFLGPPPEGCEVLHNDDDKWNPKLVNLRYDTHSENGHDATRNGKRTLTREQVQYVRARAKEGFAYGERYQLGLAWGVDSRLISYIAEGKQYQSFYDE